MQTEVNSVQDTNTVCLHSVAETPDARCYLNAKHKVALHSEVHVRIVTLTRLTDPVYVFPVL
jgi:hypothetical protein